MINFKYSLKSALLNEGLINVQTFFERISKLVKTKPMSFSGKIGKVVARNLVDESGQSILDSYTSKKDKIKLLKKLDKEVKALNLNGITGNTINIKDYKPFYDNLASFMESSGDIDFDDCIYACAFFIEQYRNLPEEEVKKVEGGSFDFEEVIKRLNFYREFLQDKTGLSGIKTKRVIDLYEDENVKIIYPTNPSSFNASIAERMEYLADSVTWCTQKSETWFNYNSNYFVCIAFSKLSDNPDDNNFIVSLKVNKDGTISYEDTCDRYNNHMDKSKISTFISEEAEAKIKEFVQTQMSDLEIVNFSKESIQNNITMLSKAGRYEDVKFILESVILNESKETISFSFKEFLNTASVIKNKIDTISEIICASCFNENNLIPIFKQDFDSLDSFGPNENFEFEASSTTKEIMHEIVSVLNEYSEEFLDEVIKNIFDKALKNRAHSRYFIAYVALNLICKQDGIKLNFVPSKENLDQMQIIAFKTNNPVTFKKAVSVSICLEFLFKHSVRNDILLESSGMLEYLKLYKSKVLNESHAYDINIETISNPAGYLISRIFKNNKELAINYIESNKDEAQIGDIDYYTIDVNTILKDLSIKALGVLDNPELVETYKMSPDEIVSFVERLFYDKDFTIKVIDTSYDKDNDIYAIFSIMLDVICDVEPDPLLSDETIHVFFHLLELFSEDRFAKRCLRDLSFKLSNTANTIEAISAICIKFDLNISDIGPTALNSILSFFQEQTVYAGFGEYLADLFLSNKNSSPVEDIEEKRFFAIELLKVAAKKSVYIKYIVDFILNSVISKILFFDKENILQNKSYSDIEMFKSIFEISEIKEEINNKINAKRENFLSGQVDSKDSVDLWRYIIRISEVLGANILTKESVDTCIELWLRSLLNAEEMDLTSSEESITFENLKSALPKISYDTIYRSFDFIKSFADTKTGKLKDLNPEQKTLFLTFVKLACKNDQVKNQSAQFFKTLLTYKTSFDAADLNYFFNKLVSIPQVDANEIAKIFKLDVRNLGDRLILSKLKDSIIAFKMSDKNTFDEIISKLNNNELENIKNSGIITDEELSQASLKKQQRPLRRKISLSSSKNESILRSFVKQVLKSY